MATSIIRDYGGPVFNVMRPEVYVIFWGSEWNSTNTIGWDNGNQAPGDPPLGNFNAVTYRTNILASLNTVCNSTHFNRLSQYRNIQRPRIAASVVHTATALPGSFGSNVTTANLQTVINACITSGQVPDPRSSSFNRTYTIGTTNMVFNQQYIYTVWLPPSRRSAVGSRAFAFKTYITQSGQPATWYNYNTLQVVNMNRTWPETDPNPPFDPPGVVMTGVGQCSAVWSHEMKHTLVESGHASDCRTGDGFQNDACGGINHAFANGRCCCGGSMTGGGMHTMTTNRSVWTESYYSDLDGRCVDPATDVGPNLGATPPPPPPVPPGSPPPAPPPPVGSPQPPLSETFEKLWVPFSNTTQIIHNTNPGFSVFCRIFPYTISRTSAGHMRCIWIKQDDKNNGAHALLGEDGSIYFNVKKDNIRYKIKTPPNVITTNAWFQVWFTFNKQTNGIDIYVNNVRYSDPSTVTEAWNDRHSHFIIGNYDTGSAIRPFRGRIDDFRLYRNGVVSSGSVGNMWENQYTIETIPVTTEPDAQVAIAGFIIIDEPIVNTNFTVGGFVDPTILPPSPPPTTPPPPGTDDAPLPPPMAAPPGTSPPIDDFNLVTPEPSIGAAEEIPSPGTEGQPVICNPGEGPV